METYTMIKNAILLAGGVGQRLLPFTKFVSKQLLPVNGKCIIDYPIETLVAMGIKNLTITVGSSFSGQVLDYVQDGSRFGINVNYCYQQKPEGIAQAINLCKRFVADDDEFVVILGDNIYTKPVVWNRDSGMAQIVLLEHSELQRFGVASLLTGLGEIAKIEEKPKILDLNYNNLAISGCYLFNQEFFDYFKKITPSARGEYEITDIIRQYHNNSKLSYTIYKGLWADAGTHDSIAFLNNYFYNGNT